VESLGKYQDHFGFLNIIIIYYNFSLNANMAFGTGVGGLVESLDSKDSLSIMQDEQ
jgi:hypothetical protein